jgi:hypothetical protein
MNQANISTCDLSDAEKGLAQSPQDSLEARIDINSQAATLALREVDRHDHLKHHEGNGVTNAKSKAVQAEREIMETKTIPCM